MEFRFILKISIYTLVSINLLNGTHAIAQTKVLPHRLAEEHPAPESPPGRKSSREVSHLVFGKKMKENGVCKKRSTHLATLDVPLGDIGASFL